MSVRFSYYICKKFITMVNLNHDLVEKEIIRAVEEINNNIQQVDAVIDEDFRPGNFIMSQVLLTAMVRIGRALGIVIPDSCYIFHDKATKTQSTIKEATQKLLKEAIYADK